jgi:hypothetical protein
MKLVLVDRWKGSFEATCIARRSEGCMLRRVFLMAIIQAKYDYST